MTLKRSREEVAAEAEVMAMANCLVLLSRPGANSNNSDKTPSLGWDFECKTCKKKFRSFQALGGHMASHKRQKIIDDNNKSLQNDVVNPKIKRRHECSVCGLEFALGQALGGHMRKHRTDDDKKSPDLLLKLTSINDEENEVGFKSNSKKMVLLDDLNLRPRENDLMVAARTASVAVVDNPKMFEFF